MTEETHTGTVAHWDDARGFGFVTPDAGSVDVFVSFATIEGDVRLAVGERVEFIAFSTPRGPRVKTARRVGEATGKGTGGIKV
jgi:CspA family cold shock protein